MEQTTINVGIFIEIEICVREGKVMAMGSERGIGADITVPSSSQSSRPVQVWAGLSADVLLLLIYDQK